MSPKFLIRISISYIKFIIFSTKPLHAWLKVPLGCQRQKSGFLSCGRLNNASPLPCDIEILIPLQMRLSLGH